MLSERQPSEGPPKAPPAGLTFAVAGWLIGQLLAGSVVSSPRGGKPIPLGTLVAGELALWAGFVGAVVLARRLLAGEFGLRARWSDASYALVGLVAQLVVVPAIYAPLHDLISRGKLEKPVHRATDAVHGGGLVLLVVVLVVGAPIVEELFFRGLVLGALRSRLSDGWAVVVSAVAFGLGHVELVQLPALVVLGVALGYLAVRTGRLGPGMWAHAAFNAVAVAAIILQR